MKITDEVEIIAPGFRRKADAIHKGYWTPELARWSDTSGFEEKFQLRYHTYVSGVRTYTNIVNASPIVCILESRAPERDLFVEITGSSGIPSGIVVSGGQDVSGFSVDNQYGKEIFRREWITGAAESDWNYGFVIEKHTPPGKQWLMPNKRIFRVNNVNVFVSGTSTNSQRINFPLTKLGFYALADNGSKLLYAFNWNKITQDVQKILFGKFAAPCKCATCKGSGNVGGNTCVQCNGYKYSGWNATGYLLDEIAQEYGVVQESGESFETYQDKIWAMKWNVYPSKKEIQRYFAHFARTDEDDIGVDNNFRVTDTSGVECIVDVTVPYIIPNTRFSKDNTFWQTMGKRCEPAGVLIRFSFLVSGQFTGTIVPPLEDMQSPQFPYTSGGVYYTGQSGNLFDTLQDTIYGWKRDYFSDLYPLGASSYPNQPWGFRSLFESTYMKSSLLHGGGGFVSGDDCVSGYGVSGAAGVGRVWYSGAMTGSEFNLWSIPSGDKAEDGVWHTGGGATDIMQYDQNLLWASGTYQWDNFWISGVGGVQY